MGWVWDLCAGLFYEHRFAMLINVYGTISDASFNVAVAVSSNDRMAQLITESEVAFDSRVTLSRN